MTTYLILRRVDTEEAKIPEGYWNPIGTGGGGNSLIAVKEFLARGENGEEFGEGEYRGVPLKSWPKNAHLIKRKVSFG